jgi:uncharacterized protein with HEPN domain
MAQDKFAYFNDISNAIELIETCLAQQSYESFKGDPILRSAVERQLIIIGEAVSKLSKHDPQAAAQLDHSSQIIAFRNQLIHNYGNVDVDIVWGVVTRYLDPLKNNVKTGARGDFPAVDDGQKP